MTVHATMPNYQQTAGDAAFKFPEGWRFPVSAVVRVAAQANDRNAGTVEIADYGRVVFTVEDKPAPHEKGSKWLFWVYTGKNGEKEAGRWQR